MLPLVFLALATVLPVDSRPSHRPAVVAEADEATDGKLAASVTRLKDLGLISDPDYWIENARKGKTCDGGMVAELLIATAKKFQPVDDLEAAVVVLKDNRILENKEAIEYWENKAVAGTKCPGRFVSRIIERIADTL